MTKRKTTPKRRKVNRRPFSVKAPTPHEFHSYDDWKQNCPRWLERIRVLIDRRDMGEARKLLDEEAVHANLKAISDSDTENRFFSHCEVAMLLNETDQAERALRYYTDALKIVDCAGVYHKIGKLYTDLGQPTQAIENFQKAEQLEPEGPYILISLAKCLMGTGQPQETLRLLRKVIRLNPHSRGAYSNLLYAMNYLPDTKPSEIFEESRKWASLQAPAHLAGTDHGNSLEPHRKLRIGYISPDFKRHSVAYFFEPLLNGHDRNKFEIYGYGDVAKPDLVTERLAEKFDFYRNITGVGDESAADLIRSDSIDILVELAGHTGRNRLGVLAYKPAPIQVTYLGYPNTTGMSQMDYRLTDAIADTPDQQQYYTEKLVFLPNGFLCYDPGEAMLPLKPLPMLTNQHVTFGCFNNINKLNPMMVTIWAEILNAVPNSKLLLKFREGRDLKVQAYYRNLFEEHGIANAKERIMISGWVTNAEHFELYNRVDIALDTYPYNGTTTTCEAFLMGVPIITLTGEHHASRVGLDLLSRLKLDSFAAKNPTEYVKKAAALASEPEGLAHIRATMRQRLAASPLCDDRKISSDIENTYRKMWQDYCGSKGLEITESDTQENADYKPQRHSDRVLMNLAVDGRKPVKRAFGGPVQSSCDPKQLLRIEQWTWPDWLKEASSFISQGELTKAIELLSEEAIEKHIEATTPPETEFIRYVAAGLLNKSHQYRRAEAMYKEALVAMPKNIAIYNELAALCREQGRVSEAVDYLTTAAKIDPDQAKIWCNLGANLMRLGQPEKAISLLRKASEKLPDNNIASSNLLLSMHYVQEIDRKTLFEESKQWAERNFPTHLARTQHTNTPDPDRRLRIGYISPDFREHSVTFFFEPLLDGHHRENVEVYGYGSIAVPDKATKRLKEKFDVYRPIQKLTDLEVADMIATDEIDILVDLAGHTGNTRVYVLGYKPAPVQATWLGYPDTTGMSQIDYRITDAIADPPGSEAFYSEELIYLPDGFLCYGPGERMPPGARLPALEKGYITFGAFHEIGKINPAVIELWSRILKATKDSKLMLKFIVGRDDEIRKMYLQHFEKQGIAPERIEIHGWLPLSEHLKLYNQVDISLDTFPYNGTTTTCQSLLMGVPVISLAGEHHMSRVSLDILSRLDMQFFAAATGDDYVKKAVALAEKPEALAKIRETMRMRMAASPLCNRELFTNHIEQAYRTMWRKWCKKQGAPISSADIEWEAPGDADVTACGANRHSR